VLFVHAGGLGDQVLFSGALAALRVARPELRVWLAVHVDLIDAVRTMSPWLAGIVPIDFYPYGVGVPGDSLYSGAAALLDVLPEGPFDAVVSAECRPTWVSWFVAGRLRPERFITLHRSFLSPTLRRLLRDRFALVYPRATWYASTSDSVHEIERYAQLLAAFGVAADTVPRWHVTPDECRSAAGLMGLEPGRFITAFPGGTDGVPYKRWPLARFAAVLKYARDEFDVEPLIVAKNADRGAVEELLRACRDLGFESRVWFDPGDDFAQTRAVFAAAAAFIGNDSGPVHASQACGVRGVTVFGGGTYPAFLSWGPSAVSVVNPLPCFGCAWDCAFGRGLCVEAVSATDANDALRAALAVGTRPPATVTVANVDAGALEIIAASSTMYRAAQADRAARFEVIQSLQRSKLIERQDQYVRRKRVFDENEMLREQARERLALVDRAGVEIDMLRAHAEQRLIELNAAVAEGDLVRAHAQERLEAIVAASGAIENLQRELAERDARIDLLQRVADERVEVIEATAAAHRELSDEMHNLQATLETRAAPAAPGVRLSELERVAHERLVALESLDTELNSVRTEAVRRAEILAEMTDMLDRQGREIERLRSRRA
jgi:ADP-heptose:LPS heptosyltransferase